MSMIQKRRQGFYSPAGVEPAGGPVSSGFFPKPLKSEVEPVAPVAGAVVGFVGVSGFENRPPARLKAGAASVVVAAVADAPLSVGFGRPEKNEGAVVVEVGPYEKEILST